MGNGLNPLSHVKRESTDLTDYRKMYEIHFYKIDK